MSNQTHHRDESLGDLCGKIADMDRPELIKVLRSLHCGFGLDFTDDFLQSVSIERLRHIVLGAVLHVPNTPCPST